MKNLNYLFPILLLASHIRQSRSYSGGAPDDRVCGTMLPGHGVSAQSDASPYITNLSSTDAKGGDTIRVTLTSQTGSIEFKGFLTMAQKLDGNLKNTGSGIPVGTFQLSSTGDNSNVKFVKCGQIGDGAVTHSSGDGKKSVTFDWVVPNDDGDFIILATFVQSFDKFWVKQPSGVIRVKRNAALGETKPTTTTPKPEKKALSEESLKRLAEFYTGCGDSKGCFGTPIGCISERNCDMFTTFRVEGTRYIFQVSGELPNPSLEKGYVAVGLSFDDKMGDDLVTGCILNRQAVRPLSYYNKGKTNTAMSNITAGFEKIIGGTGQYIDGMVFCEFIRSPKIILKENGLDYTFDLQKDDYYWMLARAGVASETGLGYHSNDKIVSSTAVPTSYIGILGAKSNILIELHAGLMIIAWLMCASTGMFTARYYKQTHTDFNPLNKAFWFVLHISCMFTTVFLTISGGIIIFIEIGGYSSGITGVGSLHPILGLVLVGLALMQVLIAFFRPHPGTAKRTLFNWIHWTIGNSAHIVGIVCIFLAKDLTKSGLQREGERAYIPVVAGFVVFHVVMHVVMAIHTLWADKQMDTQVKMRSVRPGPMKPSGKSDEAPGTRLRTAILILYLAGCAGVAITLIVLIVSGLNE